MAFGKREAEQVDYNAVKNTRLVSLQDDSAAAQATFDIATSSLEKANMEIDKEIAELTTHIQASVEILKGLKTQRADNQRILDSISKIFGSPKSDLADKAQEKSPSESTDTKEAK